MRTKWIYRFDTFIAEKATKPGVWRRRDGGFVVRARVRDPDDQLGAPGRTPASDRRQPDSRQRVRTSAGHERRDRLFERRLAHPTVRRSRRPSSAMHARHARPPCRSPM